jgi:uncharacterized membrane protein YdjX (TVP38/TMEM64 family)
MSPSLPKDSQESIPARLTLPWSHPRRRSSAGSRSPAFMNYGSTTFRDNLINKAERLSRRVLATIEKMTPLQRVLAAAAFVVATVLGILFLVFNEKIFGALEPFAEKWKDTTGGWTILWAITFVAAFPPMIGYSTCATTAGFVYGIWEGWLILATATVVGSTCSLIASRTVLRKYVERWVASDKRFAALTLTLKHDGVKLLCMIRLCPLPYSLSNGAMSTFPTVSPAMYALATTLITPKLFIHVFIGSRLAAIARKGEKMTASDRAVNYASIAIGAVVGAFTGWYIYRKTMARAAELGAEEIASVRDSVRRTGMPPREFSDDPEAVLAAETLIEDDVDDDPDFFDEDTPVKSGYRDESDAESDVFGAGDGDDDDDDAIGLKRQSR